MATVIRDELDVTGTNEATDSTCFPTFVKSAAANSALCTNTALTFNSNAGQLGATSHTSPGTAGTTWGVERNTTSNTAGNSLTLTGGGATSGATDKDGGALILKPGASTGTGKAAVKIQRYSRAAATGTADNTAFDALVVGGAQYLTHNTATALFDVSMTDLQTCGGTFQYGVGITNGTDGQFHSGHCTYAAVRKGANITATIVDEAATDDAYAETDAALTLTESFTIVTDAGNNKFTVKATLNSNLSGTPVYKMRWNLHHFGESTITPY